ncbi:thioredoxin, putative [Theileria equi strain WA]|uniref:Thioredoxin n=1 Tax=Theileria equi strain WA TaxID=1537102 RepID=L0B1F0_THEEQ|nr:thioredoxin, putative [Theileria equi strain WA]AFZ81076.1 thioredoxin, putative [Theileria equi strain WA]|eukprot:XP_004830742.1 thioredoxin, putative [Theileria equi strain WA]
MVHQVESVEEFKKSVQAGGVVVVDFFATWCGPCVRFAPRFDALSQSYPGAVFLKVDVDKVPELQNQYGITGIPAFKVFKDGSVVAECVGANEELLKASIEKALAL